MKIVKIIGCGLCSQRFHLCYETMQNTLEQQYQKATESIPANLSPFGEIRRVEIKIGHPRE